MPARFRTFVERRVPHFLAVYLGAGWGLIQFISFLEDRYAISPVWTNLALLAWLLLVPSVVLYTWNHGRPGKDEWVRSEKIGIPLNVVLTLVVLTVAFGGDDLGATMRRVTITDESGAQIERAVPKSAFRKRVALYWFETPATDTAVAWLREGATIALGTDLMQDLFVDVRTPQHFREKLREAGSNDGNNVPLALKQRVAQEMHLPYFVTGSVAHGANGYTVRTQLYQTSTSRVVSTREITSTDLLQAIDDLSLQLRQDLQLPTQLRGADMRDLPVAELLSSNVDAVRALATGLAAIMRDDWAAADAAFTNATTLDPTFAYAHLALYQTRSMRGDPQSGMPHLAKALQHNYRLPERMHMFVKVENFLMQQEKDKALQVANMMVELYPDDVMGHQLSAQLYIYRNEHAKAIASLRKVLELDPQQQETMLTIGAMQETMGAHEDALRTYFEYAKLNPSDASTLTRAARIQQRLGRLDEAKQTFERAILAEPTNVEAKVDLALLARNTGDSDGALRQLQQALGTATTAEDTLRALSGMRAYYEGGGRMRDALATLDQQLAVSARVVAPIQLIGMQLGSLGLLVEAGQRARAEATVASARARLTPPLDNFWQMGELIIAVETDDTARIPAARAAVQSMIDGFGFAFLSPIVTRADAHLLEMRGDWNGAVQAYERLLQLDATSTGVKRDIARCMRNAGRLDDALRVVEEHLRSAPYAAESNVEAARIRLAKNDAAGARQHLERAARTLANADADYDVARDVKQLLAQVGTR